MTKTESRHPAERTVQTATCHLNALHQPAQQATVHLRPPWRLPLVQRPRLPCLSLRINALPPRHHPGLEELCQHRKTHREATSVPHAVEEAFVETSVEASAARPSVVGAEEELPPADLRQDSPVEEAAISAAAVARQRRSPPTSARPPVPAAGLSRSKAPLQQPQLHRQRVRKGSVQAATAPPRLTHVASASRRTASRSPTGPRLPSRRR